MTFFLSKKNQLFCFFANMMKPNKLFSLEPIALNIIPSLFSKLFFYSPYSSGRNTARLLFTK